MKPIGSRVSIVLASTLLCALLIARPAERASGEERRSSADSLRAALASKTAEIFKRGCATSGCHAGAYPKARLSLEPEKMASAVENVPSRQIDTLMLVDTKAPQRSYLLMKVRGTEGIRGKTMPLGASALKAADIRTIELWAASLERSDAGAAATPPGKKPDGK